MRHIAAPARLSSRSTRPSWAGSATQRLIAGLLACVALAGSAQAGPLLDRIRAHRAAKATSEVASSADAAQVTPTTSLAPGDHTFTLNWQGEARQWQLHVPPSFKPDHPVAVVYFFHGGGGNMQHSANDKFYGQISSSDRLGHLAVFPNGHGRLKSGKLATWNAGNCCGAARDDNTDDVGFVRAIHAELFKRFQIDPQKVFAAGMSNGGMMAHRLACDASDLFRAITAVAGTDNTRNCQPSRPVSVLHIHARDDERVLFNGGAGQPSKQVTEFTSVAESTSRWVKRNSCQATPRKVLEVPGAQCVEHDGCQGGSRVRLCVTDTGGHSWPGGGKVLGKRGSQALSATAEMERFFFGP